MIQINSKPKNIKEVTTEIPCGVQISFGMK